MATESSRHYCFDCTKAIARLAFTEGCSLPTVAFTLHITAPLTFYMQLMNITLQKSRNIVNCAKSGPSKPDAMLRSSPAAVLRPPRRTPDSLTHGKPIGLRVGRLFNN